MNARAHDLIRKIVQTSPADQTEALLVEERSSLTRFTHSAIHQNVSEDNATLSLRVFLGKRCGTATTNLLSEEGARETLDQAIEIARNQSELPWQVQLSGQVPLPEADTWREETDSCTPEQRARDLQPAFARAEGRGTTLMGAYQTVSTDLCVVNSRGVSAHQRFTMSEIGLFARKNGSFGYASRRRRSVRDLDIPALEEIASGKALRGASPRPLPVGRYDVVLEPAAVATLLEWLSFVSFGAKSVLEGSSFLAGNAGKKVMGENMTFYDDGMEDPETACPFDYEGTPKKRVVLVDHGIAGLPVTDCAYASRAGTASTGHSSGPGSGSGPIPMNLSIAPGNVPRAEILRRLGKGILVTRFHYVNGLLKPRVAQMTGMTKDGTFWVEGGEIVSGIENMRFTEALTEAFQRVEAISAERERFRSWMSFAGGCLVPALLIRDFTFSGKA